MWACDPIDGTFPYSKGVPVSVFSLALVKDGIPLVGVVYDPFTDRLYSASLDGGAYLNDSLIQVSNNDLDYNSVINVEWWPEAKFDIDTALHNLSIETGVYVLHIGSVIQAACLVAAGRYEACLFPGIKAKNVDIAAVKVIVEEAGGKVTDLFGNEQRYDIDIKGAIISNGTIHEKLVSLSEKY